MPLRLRQMTLIYEWLDLLPPCPSLPYICPSPLSTYCLPPRRQIEIEMSLSGMTTNNTCLPNHFVDTPETNIIKVKARKNESLLHTRISRKRFFQVYFCFITYSLLRSQLMLAQIASVRVWQSSALELREKWIQCPIMDIDVWFCFQHYILKFG